MSNPIFDAKLASLSISSKMRELSDKHVKERRTLGEKLAANSNIASASIRAFFDLHEKQLKESLEVRLECVLEAVEIGKFINETVEKELLKYLIPFTDNQTIAVTNSMKQLLARQSFPKTSEKSTLDGFQYVSNKLKSNIKDKLKIEIRKRNNKLNSIEKNETKLLDEYVDKSRLAELNGLSTQKFDLSKLIRYCEELNHAYKNECFLSIAMILRSIINHVPPVFGFNKFTEVVNNYSSTTSFKETITNLNRALRKIADSHLHVIIRKKESLPSFAQVNFRAELDVLLSEIVRILK
jgi:hypothetical protein